ncbi:Rapamycin-insensitive companion of mTOR, N-term-domain-containing protein [Fomitopsis serialis]|uniref:Rapamycin-insensitive companion of mTOR, N-term-domain-containing protein n=1 Tax=Fomitopsis serialis TaxID=139415 RepID=UPI0020080F1F|nr:Rapamycin-insensitive companion of mTOR, N-term-domain-containing protein [Neoantrodia serialis]KAH9936411.1 Rapamycin-insensitive companion of mTOR, N-term-domain-containing protein [Neoantrodia serialis]
MPSVVVDHASSSGSTQRLGDAGMSAYTNLTGTTLANGGSSFMTHSGTNGDSRGLDMSEEQAVPDQFEKLHTELKIANAIKEGAENMLQMPLTDTLRLQVESELEVAKNKISAITSTIETYSSKGNRKQGPETTTINGKGRPHRPPPMHVKHTTEAAEDFRSAMQQANSCMRTLLSSYRSTPAAPSPSGASPSTSPSSSVMSSVTVANGGDLERARVEAMTRLVTVLQRNLRVRYELEVEEVVKAVLPSLSDRSLKHSRATAYRLIRHSLVDFHSVERLKEQKLDWFMVKSLSRDNKYAVEKEQVIKLIRAIVEIGSERRGPGGTNARGAGAVPLSNAVLRALNAVAESVDDPFRPICLQTLTEILVIDIELMAKTGGIRVLLHALADGPPEMAPLLASVFLHIVDCPSTRAYLRPGIDLEMALSGVTDAYGKGLEHVDRMRACSRVVTSMLRTWSGLIYFCIQDKLAIRSLVDGLRIPSLETREVILDMFFDLLNIRAPDWHQAFIAGRRLTIYRKSATSDQKELPPLPEPAQRPQVTVKLIEHFLALLIQVLCGAGLLDALTCMLEESPVGSNLSRKAVLLMAEILQMSNRVLPLSIAAHIQALPRVFNLASDYSVGEHRIIGNSALSSIDSFNRHRARVQPAPVTDKCDTRPRANSVEDAVRRGQRQVQQDKMKQAMQMDDKAFQAILLDSQVMTAKDPSKWNFEVLQELIEGPLLNPKRMEEAIRVSRYMRKLMSFFHPFSHKFSELPKTKANIRWVRLGCQLLNALLTSSEGVKFLGEDDLLNQIVKSFAQLDPFNGAPTSDPIFSKKRMNETLTFGYFEMLGTLSKRKEGLELLEKFKLFTAFYHLTELRSREDLLKGIIENLDYSYDGHSRIVLSKALTSSYKHIREFATNHLGALIRASATTNSWTLRLLLTQLYDPAIEVREVAVRFLEEACESPDVLQSVVEMQPTLDHLGEMGHPLMLKFMSTPMGFRFLYSANYIDREMDIWFHERNLQYVVYIEVFLAKIFSPSGDEDEDALTLESMVPPHFYGVMAKTELGYQVLQEKGHFAEFAEFIRQHGLESVDHDLIMKLKSVLWAVGNIGATEGGLTLLEDEEIIPEIIKIAEESLVLSVRGTCFFVLGLIASTPQGAEILDDYHWEATLSPLGIPTGICVPVDVEKFTYIPPWGCVANEGDDDVRLEPPKTEEEMEVMAAIYNLANTVIANTASRSLAKMKTRPEYRHIFSSSEMYFRALHTISSQKYRLPVRRYILDLFDVELDAAVVGRLSEYATTLRVHKPAKPSFSRIVSIVGRPNPEHRASDSEDEDEDEDERVAVVEKPPVMSLRPMSKIVGFDGSNYFD